MNTNIEKSSHLIRLGSVSEETEGWGFQPGEHWFTQKWNALGIARSS